MAKAITTPVATKPVNSVAAAVAVLMPAVNVQPTEGTGNGGQTRFNVSIHSVSISSLTRALASAPVNLPRLSIMALYAAMRLPVSPATVKAQHGSGKGKQPGQAGPHGITPDYAKMPQALRDGIKGLMQAIIAADAVASTAATLNSDTVKPTPASYAGNL